MAKFIVIHSVKVATDFTPETFGRLTTIGPKFLVGRKNNPRKDAYQVCVCECGTVHIVARRSLKDGGTVSCGCRKLDKNIKRLTKHGDYNSPEYRSWNGAKNRCCNKYNIQYYRYGGRGIGFCDRWRDTENGYANFLADMGRKPSSGHSLDRIDVNGDYCPENCRWATTIEQNRNKRSNKNITYLGKTQCIATWAEEYGIAYTLLCGRIAAGWNTHRALHRKVTKSNVDEFV